MEDINFKPTKELEFDIMKSLLDDYDKLSCFIEMLEESKFVWQNQMNQKLFQLIEKQFHKTKNKSDFNIETFYSKLLAMAKNKIPDFNVNLYLDLYEQNFKFNRTLLNYSQYYKNKKTAKKLFEISAEINGIAKIIDLNQFDAEEAFDKLELVKKEIGVMLNKIIF